MIKIKMIGFIALRGATAWEAQLGRAWIRVLFPRFWRTSWPVEMGWETDD